MQTKDIMNTLSNRRPEVWGRMTRTEALAEAKGVSIELKLARRARPQAATTKAKAKPAAAPLTSAMSKIDAAITAERAEAEAERQSGELHYKQMQLTTLRAYRKLNADTFGPSKQAPAQAATVTPVLVKPTTDNSIMARFAAMPTGPEKRAYWEANRVVILRVALKQ